MSRNNDLDDYDEGREEEGPYDSASTRAWYWPSPFGAWPPLVGDRQDAERYDPAKEGANDSSWGGGLITLLIVIGAVLFVFPEPATSAVGILLIAIGVIGWLIGWIS